ncbi:LOB domain-containing protein 36 [Glycine soja]
MIGRVAGLESSYACGSSAQETRKQTNKGLPPSLYIIPLSSLSFCLSHVNFYLPSRRSIHSWSQEEERLEKMSSSSNSPCAACKFLRRKCTQECVFAPYFPPDNPQRFAYVHKVFGASNVAKLLNELSAAQRDDAVKSLAYEAEARLRDPVYGCVGLISVLQHKLRQIQVELNNAKKELATYIGPQAIQGIPAPMLQQHPNNPFPGAMYGNMPTATAAVHGGQLVIRDAQPAPQQQQQQILEAQQLAAAVAAREQQEMFRSYEHQQQQEFLRFSGGFDVGSASSAGGFSQVSPAAASADQLSPSLALGSFDNAYHMQQPQQEEPHHHHHHPHHIPLEAQLLLPPQQKQQTHHESQLPLHQQHSDNEERRSFYLPDTNGQQREREGVDEAHVRELDSFIRFGLLGFERRQLQK